MSKITTDIRTFKQVRDNIVKASNMLQKKGIEQNAMIGIITNWVHESWCNPWTLQDGMPPGPPQGANGVGPGGGLGQWTPWEGKIKLGDWDQQINFMMKDTGQFMYPGSWGAYGATMPENSPKTLGEFFKNPHKLSAETMNKVWVVQWERPDYALGAGRIQTAKGDSSVVAQYISKNAIGDPVPQWPFKFPTSFTQAPFQPEFDHKDTSAYDYVNSSAPQDHSNVIAPANMTCSWSSPVNATAAFVTDEKVYCADGKTGYLVIIMAHSEVVSDYTVGRKIKNGGVMFHLGNGGASTGVHGHMSVGRSSQKLGGYGDGWTLVDSQTGLGADIVVTRSPLGNVSNAILPNAPAKNKLPNSLTTEPAEDSKGRVTANNVFSVTDGQKSNMSNQSEVYVNIGAFKYVTNSSSTGGGGEEEKPKQPNYKGQSDRIMAIFHI